jgi:hypothetical protein
MDVELAVVVMPIVRPPFALAVCCLAVIGGPRAAHAQNVAAAEPSACVAATGPDSGVAAPDTGMRSAPRTPRDTAQHTAVRLFAAVRADEVQFARQPKICVKLSGDVRLDSVRVVGRRNLASPVVSGTTYRNIYVAVEILGHLNAECISARITGAAPTGQAAGPCASIGVRDTTAGRRSGAPPP